MFFRSASSSGDALAALSGDIWRYRYLVFQITRMMVERRCRSSALCLLWAVLTSLALLAVYTLAFSLILGIRLGGIGQSVHFSFAVVLFCGLTAFDLFSQSVNQAPDIMTNNPSFVKKAIFPIQILPVALAFSGLADSLVRLVILRGAGFGSIFRTAKNVG